MNDQIIPILERPEISAAQRLLHPQEDAFWQEFQQASGTAYQLDRENCKRRMSRRRFPTFFPPTLLDIQASRQLEQDTLALAQIVRSIPERIFGGDIQRWLDFLRIEGAEARLLLRLATPRFLKVASHFVRPDFILTERGAKIVEINVSPSLGGMNTVNSYLEAFRKSDYFAFLASRGLTPHAHDLNSAWATAFREVACHSAGKPAPVMFEARVDPQERPTGHQMFGNRANVAGYTAIQGMLQELEVSDRGVSVDGEPVDAIVSMYTWSEFRRFVPHALALQLAEADERGLVDFIAPPVSALFDSKSNLELLSDDRYASHYDAAERALIKRYLPATFRLDRSTAGRALDEQQQLVLKPADESGGRGILMGREVSGDCWRAQIEQACASSASAVCQEILPPLQRRVVTDGEAAGTHFVSIAPLLFGRHQAGMLVRQMRERDEMPILNVKSGAEAAVAFAF